MFLPFFKNIFSTASIPYFLKKFKYFSEVFLGKQRKNPMKEHRAERKKNQKNKPIPPGIFHWLFCFSLPECLSCFLPWITKNLYRFSFPKSCFLRETIMLMTKFAIIVIHVFFLYSDTLPQKVYQNFRKK